MKKIAGWIVVAAVFAGGENLLAKGDLPVPSGDLVEDAARAPSPTKTTVGCCGRDTACSTSVLGVNLH